MSAKVVSINPHIELGKLDDVLDRINIALLRNDIETALELVGRLRAIRNSIEAAVREERRKYTELQFQASVELMGARR